MEKLGAVLLCGQDVHRAVGLSRLLSQLNHVLRLPRPLGKGRVGTGSCSHLLRLPRPLGKGRVGTGSCRCLRQVLNLNLMGVLLLKCSAFSVKLQQLKPMLLYV